MQRLTKTLAFSLSYVLLVTSLALPAAAQQPAATPPRTATPQQSTATQVTQQAQQQTAAQAATQSQQTPIDRIKDEGMNRSQVMQTLTYLTDVIGSRLTGSRGMRRANEWTRDKMTQMGLQNARLEEWGPFGRGWELKDFSMSVVAPQAIPIIAHPKAWSPGTNGEVTADVVLLDAKDENDLQRFKGKLRGKVVLVSPVREVKARFEAPGTRLSEKELLALADAPDPASRTARRPSFLDNPRAKEFISQAVFNQRKLQMLVAEGAAMMIDAAQGDGGTVFVQEASVPVAQIDSSSPQAIVRSIFFGRVRPYGKNAPQTVPQAAMAVEHYNRLVRMLQAGEAVKMRVRLDAEMTDAEQMGYNTIAELPGTDKGNEIVMLGGHLDSWHGGTGATDNAAGCAVAMEAVRILKALNLQPRRTIRVALWSGEEQGLYGSRAYVSQHFAKIEEPEDAGFMRMVSGGGAPPKITPGADYEKLSVYFNLDNGTGKIRGVYMQGNEAARPLFREWLAPFKEMGAQTLTIANTGGTDHLSFDAVGLPGFQFIQDEIEYDTRTHHSNMDTFDRIQADDMKQAATVMAAFIYNAAMADERFPRKPAKP